MKSFLLYMKKPKVFVPILLIAMLAIIYTIEWSHKKHPRDKIIKEISSPRLPDSRFDVKIDPASFQKVLDITKQPFFYLGMGLQSVAFQSLDGEYVIKFVLHKKLHIGKYVTDIPSTTIERLLKPEKYAANTEKMNKLFESFLISYRDLSQETGTLYVHLNKTQEMRLPKITLVDFRGTLWHVSLDQCEFVIQKKAKLLKQTIIRLMYDGKTDEAKKCISDVFNLLRAIAKKGVQDTDGALIRNDNIGLLEDRAILIDTGKLIENNSMKKVDRFTKDLKRVQPLRKWLEKNYPELVPHYNTEYNSVIKDF
jgi:hypothetical protein